MYVCRSACLLSFPQKESCSVHFSLTCFLEKQLSQVSFLVSIYSFHSVFSSSQYSIILLIECFICLVLRAALLLKVFKAYLKYLHFTPTLACNFLKKSIFSYIIPFYWYHLIVYTDLYHKYFFVFGLTSRIQTRNVELMIKFSRSLFQFSSPFYDIDLVGETR